MLTCRRHCQPREWVSQQCLDELSDEIVCHAIVDYEENNDNFDVISDLSDQSDDDVFSDLDE